MVAKMKQFLEAGPHFEYGYDQQFLSSYLYPVVQDNCHMFGTGGEPIPVPYDGPGHVGAPDGAHNAEEREAWKIGEMERLCRE